MDAWSDSPLSCDSCTCHRIEPSDTINRLMLDGVGVGKFFVFPALSTKIKIIIRVVIHTAIFGAKAVPIAVKMWRACRI